MNVILNKLVFWDVGRRMDCKDLFLIKKVMYDLMRKHIDFISHYFLGTILFCSFPAFLYFMQKAKGNIHIRELFVLPFHLCFPL